MSNDRHDINYKGPSRDFNPDIGSARPTSGQAPATFDHEMYSAEVLRDQLDEVIKQTDLISVQAESELKRYNLKITTPKLLEAQKAIWPENIAEVKEYVTYKQYKALENKMDRASKYIRDQYVASIRGEDGTGALDVQRLAKVLNSEATNIKGFLNAYTKDIDDSAQKRVEELFQDWSKSAITHTGRLWSYFKERGPQSTSKIPESELAAIDDSDTGRYQALFKAKVNAVNQDLDRELSNFERHFMTTSDIFYHKFLGPSVNFRMSASKDLEMKANDTTVLGAEVKKAIGSLDTNMQVGLTDLLHRNQIFSLKIETIEDRIGTRESLKQILKQISEKSGIIASNFTETFDTGADDSLYEGIINSSTSSSQFLSSHNSLSGRELDDAHSQYVLSSGDTITGDITVADGVTIDGVDLSAHNHSGQDGSAKISGSGILEGSLLSEAVDIDESVPKPVNIKVTNFIDGGSYGTTSFLNAKLFWESDDQGQLYEIQITQRDSIS
jgi:hypothetical protein